MENSNKISVSEEDEEDLEALRLAALQSLKRKNIANNDVINNCIPHGSELNEFVPVPDHTAWYSGRGGRHFLNKRGRFYGPRGAKNGQFAFHPIPRMRSSNLIAITPVGSDESNDTPPQQSSVSHKLTLPQDRFYSSEKIEAQSNDSSSKFKRYDNSDESEEESEEEKVSEDSEEENIEKLTRSDSLEALMQELDDEIQGKTTKSKEEKPIKTKTKVKRKKNVVTSTDSKLKLEREKETDVEPKLEPDTVVKPDVNEPLEEDNNTSLDKSTEEPAPKKQRNSPPPPHRPFYDNRRNNRGFAHGNFRRGYQNPPRYPPPVQFPNVPPPLPHLNLNMSYMPPAPFFDRPVSPLAINTESLQTQTMAPLSPRSAAFVLQNRAIVEKRKRSPRRSYSRSPSPRLRSLSPRSPRRSLSPSWRKSRSRSPPNRRSLSPRRRSISPRRNPIRKANPPASTSLPKNTRPRIRERLGVKSNSKQDDKKITPEKDLPVEPDSRIEEKPLDPVLEARKRKFETKEITVKEGVIRLKPKEDKEQTQKDEMEVNTDKETQKNMEENVENKSAEEDLIDEDALLEDDEIELEAKLDFFSDEESGSENEGRFKTKHHSSVPKPPVLSFSKLVNGTKEHTLETKPLIEHRRRPRRGPDRTRNFSTKIRSRSAEKNEITTTSSTIEKTEGRSESLRSLGLRKDSLPHRRSRIVMKSERHPENSKKFERKIEIKIKNPSKYERIVGDKSQEKPSRLKFARDDEEKCLEKVTRKVEVENKNKKIMDDEENEGAASDDDIETEVVVENGSDEEEENNVSSEGDLRAQLSKKRAEKLHKILPAESVPSRLLQNALQGVVFKKVKKSKSKSRELSISDGKLPIHLRLGTVGQSDIFETKIKRKSRKRKNREMQEQV